MEKHGRKTRCAALLVAATAWAIVGCDGDGGKKLTPIDTFGITDLDYDTTPLPDPKVGLPQLESLEPEVDAGLADQELPGEEIEILEADKAAIYAGYGAEELAAVLRADGVARQATISGRELMAQALESLAADPERPGVLLTADAVFDTFHTVYDNVLLGVEIETLRPRLLAMLGAVKAEAAKRYNSLPPGPTRDAALDVVAYLQVAESLMEPSAEMVAEVAGVAQLEIEAVEALAIEVDGEPMPFGPSPLFDRPEESSSGDPECVDCDPCAATPAPEGEACGWYEGPADDPTFVACGERYCEDYSQYKPRGHYTYSEQLERYFRSVMWLGRMTFLNRSDRSTRGAVVLVDSLKDAEVAVGGEEPSAIEIWRQAVRAIGTFVGSMDDLNAAEIDAAILAAMGGGFSLAELDGEAALDALHAEIAALHDPAIQSGFLSSLADAGAATKGLRLLGQAFVPDSYAMGELVFGGVGASATADPEGYAAALAMCGLPEGSDPETLSAVDTRCVCKSAWRYLGAEQWDVCRGLPSGLDVASVLGDATAQALALDLFGSYAGYPERMQAIADELAAYGPGRWGMSVGWTWLYALSGLLADVDPGAPAFMRTDAWEAKNLETALTSWAELRHDTILYAKPSATSDVDADGDGDTDGDTDEDYDFEYVEPQPAAYARLLAATRRLEALALGDALVADESGAVMEALADMRGFLETAAEISVAELEGRELAAADVGWIRYSGARIAQLQDGLLTGLELLGEDEEPDPDRLKTTVVADVHTWPQAMQVLEVGSGYLDYVVVLHRLPGGQWGVAVGPAFTYHEFPHPLADRLTDEQWREMLAADPDHGRPSWLP